MREAPWRGRIWDCPQGSGTEHRTVFGCILAFRELQGRVSAGIAFSPCLFRFKINLAFPRSGLYKHCMSRGGELPSVCFPLALGEVPDGVPWAGGTAERPLLPRVQHHTEMELPDINQGTVNPLDKHCPKPAAKGAARRQCAWIRPLWAGRGQEVPIILLTGTSPAAVLHPRGRAKTLLCAPWPRPGVSRLLAVKAARKGQT